MTPETVSIGLDDRRRVSMETACDVTARPPMSGVECIAQTWDGETLISEVGPMSYDGARHVAQAATITGHTGRLMAQGVDWCEVYRPDGTSCEGTFAQTVHVRVAWRAPEPEPQGPRCACGRYFGIPPRPNGPFRKGGGTYHTQRECFALDPATGATCLWARNPSRERLVKANEAEIARAEGRVKP